MFSLKIQYIDTIDTYNFRPSLTPSTHFLDFLKPSVQMRGKKLHIFKVLETPKAVAYLYSGHGHIHIVRRNYIAGDREHTVEIFISENQTAGITRERTLPTLLL